MLADWAGTDDFRLSSFLSSQGSVLLCSPEVHTSRSGDCAAVLWVGILRSNRAIRAAAQVDVVGLQRFMHRNEPKISK